MLALAKCPPFENEFERSADLLLPNVSCLDMSGTSSVQAETQEISSLNYIEAFAAMLPNLEELDLCYSRMPRNVLYLNIASVTNSGEWKVMRVVDWSTWLMDFSVGFPAHWRSFVLTRTTLNCIAIFLANSDSRVFVFDRCRSLERLSIKNASWYTRNRKEVSQEMLIKMVLNHRSRIALA